MNQNGAASGRVKPAAFRQTLANPVSSDTLRQFFRFTGGSPLFCLSAVFVAYGIVKLLGPILAESAGLRQAMPCLLTLHAYEAAMLGALLLIVFRKVVDDALSLAILIGLFVVCTSMALGAVGDSGAGAFGVGLTGIALGGVKLGLLRRYAKIPFGKLTLAGLMILLAANYLGPLMLARALDMRPGDTPGHRALWFWMCLFFLLGGAVAVFEALRGRLDTDSGKKSGVPFLRQSAMSYLFVLVVLAASGVHLYSMAYSFALPREMGDFMPLAAMGCLLLIEVLRHAGKRFGIVEILLACTPLALMLWALYIKEVPASGHFSSGLIAYPPVLLALCGFAVAAMGIWHGRLWFIAAAFAYAMGVILTAGYSPLEPHTLNYMASGAVFGTTVLLVGIVLFNPYICLVSVVGAVFAMALWKGFPATAQAWGLTQVGGLAGIMGAGAMGVLLIFGRALHPVVRLAGAVCLSVFVFDWLPSTFGWRYATALILLILLATALWYRTRDAVVISILLAPLAGRVYIAARYLAYWRMVIVGFILLAGGTSVSLQKRRQEIPDDNVPVADSPPKNDG